jgi:signal transduction histidine kinase
MSAIASRLKRRWLEAVWAVWVVVNTIVIFRAPDAAPIPYHNIWLSLALVYGIRMWSVRTALVMLVVIATISGAALVATVDEGSQAAGIPTLSGLFLIMVWFMARAQRATEELHRSAARERDFVRDASHQLRTPITVARGHAELILSAPDPEVAADAEIVIGEMDRLSRISDRLLILASAELPQLLARAPVDLSHLVEAAADRWRPTAARAWRLRVDARGTIVGDATQIETALDAIIENAIKATVEGDRIEIRLRSEADVAVIDVSDNGIGIEPENLERVFDRFWRADSPGGAHNGGTGLGLSMVRAIAQAHGGSADAVLRPLGGTTIRMRLSGFTANRNADFVTSA